MKVFLKNKMGYKKYKERIKSIESIGDKEAMLWKVDGKICRRIGLEHPAEGPKDREEAIRRGAIFVPRMEIYLFPQPGEYLLPEEKFPEIAYLVFYSKLKVYRCESEIPLEEICADERSGPDLSRLLFDLTLFRDLYQGEIRKKELESYYLMK